jgi:hypothetical protein
VGGETEGLNDSVLSFVRVDEFGITLKWKRLEVDLENFFGLMMAFGWWRRWIAQSTSCSRCLWMI